MDDGVEELVERSIELACSIDAAVEEQQAGLGRVLALVEVVGDQASEGVGLGEAKRLLDALSVGLKHSPQQKLVLPLTPAVAALFIIRFVVVLLLQRQLIMTRIMVVVVDLMNLGPNFIVGLALDGAGVLVGESGGGRCLRARSSLRRGRRMRMSIAIGSRCCC